VSGETMFAYAGTYTVEADKAIHHVDISWNHFWTGADQVRCFKLTENTFIIATSEINPTTGRPQNPAMISLALRPRYVHFFRPPPIHKRFLGAVIGLAE
jgi:hypothetical protein